MNADVLGPQRVGLLQNRAWDFWFAPKRFERPPLYEVIHLGAFIAFLLFSIWQLVSGRTNGMGFVIACVVYVLLILSPVLLQRYNRIRAYEAIGRMRKKQVPL